MDQLCSAAAVALPSLHTRTVAFKCTHTERTGALTLFAFRALRPPSGRLFWPIWSHFWYHIATQLDRLDLTGNIVSKVISNIMLTRTLASRWLNTGLSRCCMSSSTCLAPDSRVVTLDDGKQRPWYAGEQDPRKHNISHAGLFYIMPEEDEMIKMFGKPNPFHNLNVAPFHKCIGFIPVMIRQPALTAMNKIGKLDDQEATTTTTTTRQTKKILLFGDEGHGKGHALAHIIHYLYLKEKYFIISSPDIRVHTTNPRETSPSTSRPGRVDTPIMAALALQQFRIQNANLLKQHEETLRCSQDYKWSARETTKMGDPLVALADHGVNRVMHASDCFAVLVKELMKAADEGKIKLSLVARDVSFLFLEFAGYLRHPDWKSVLVDEMTVARTYKKLIGGKYNNGLVVVSAQDRENRLHQNQTPESVLSEEGLKYLEGADRIHVPKYSRQEFENCMNFYEDIGWLTRPVSRTGIVRDEVRFTSGLNPRQVDWLCRGL